MTEFQRGAYPVELAEMLNRFFLNLDAADYDALLSLTHRHFRWHRQGKILDGHGAVADALRERPLSQRVVHVITNTVVEHRQEHRVTLGAYMTAYRFDDGRAHQGPVSIRAPLRLSRVTTHFEDDARVGWRIAEQVLAPVFEFAAT